MKKYLLPSAFLIVVISIIILVAYWPGKNSNTQTSQQIEGASTINKVELAQHLTKIGAKIYGAYWCSACAKQKELFGPDASAKIDYRECDANGENSKAAECDQEEITSYPTWIINNQKYIGVRSLEELAQISNFQ